MGKRGPKPKPGPREKNGRLQREPTVEQRRLVLEARAARAGVKLPPGTIPKETAAMLSQPWMGCAPGRAIAQERDAAELWATICEIRGRREAYLRSIDAPDPWPAVAKLGVAPSTEEPFGDPIRHDLRDESDKARAAEAAWAAVTDAIRAIDPVAERYILFVVCEEVRLPCKRLVPLLRRIREGMGL